MIYEVDAAVQHIVSLVRQVERGQPLPSDALAAFSSTLKDALENRCQKCWNPTEPEAGSAHRSVAWQLHPGGEGADLDLLGAFASVVQANADEGEIVRPHHSSVVALACEWLPFSFTLWIDPGCVAVRLGSGPGANRSSYDFDHLRSGAAPSSVHVIWGQMIAQPAEQHVPQLTVSSATSAAARPIPIVKPNPSVAHARYPINLFSHVPAAQRHSRTNSTASSTSSSYQSLVRSASYSSAHTASTDATSLGGFDVEADTDADADAVSETCPSLCSPSSSLASSQCTPNSEADRESVHDTTVGADTTQRFAGVRLFDDDEQDDEAGDATIDASPMLGINVSKHAASHSLGASFTPAKPMVSSTPVKCNYTTHDNGNVGVLGGGVRLGGSSKPCQPPRHRQHSNSKSISHIQGGFHNQLLPSAYIPAALTRQRQFNHMTAANYSAPLPTVPLPGAPHQQYAVRAQQVAYAQQQPVYQHQVHRPVVGGMAPFAPHQPSQLPTPYGYGAAIPFPHYVAQQQPPQQQQQQQQQQHNEVEDAERTAGGGRRRLRSRGRRSRGRGAGRAARRQAAALRALELGSTDELPEFQDEDEEDDEEEDDLISRCSTPATSSDYTYSSSTASSSVYSSAASSPAKRANGRMSNRGSRSDLRAAAAAQVEFGLKLQHNLARLHVLA